MVYRPTQNVEFEAIWTLDVGKIKEWAEFFFILTPHLTEEPSYATDKIEG